MRVFLVLVIAAVGGIFWWWTSGAEKMAIPGRENQIPIVSGIIIPELDAGELAGKAAFEENCAACHGVNAAGNDGFGPPLVHVIYEPNHHGDGAFVVAARNGVRAHHWKFGDMPPVEGITDDEVVLIVAYVRKLQRANGID